MEVAAEAQEAAEGCEGRARCSIPQIQLSNSSRARRHSFAISRPDSPELCRKSRALNLEEGAGKTGCALHPRSRVQIQQKKRTRAYRFSGNTPAFPAQWFYGLLRALLGEPGFLATVISGSLPANLTPASGCRDHATSPYAAASFVL